MLLKGGTGVNLTPVPPLKLFNHWIIKGKEPPKMAIFLVAINNEKFCDRSNHFYSQGFCAGRVTQKVIGTPGVPITPFCNRLGVSVKQYPG